MRILRASELGSFLYCQRAWWYRSQGIESENSSELAAGSGFHRDYGAKILQARLFSWVGFVLLAAALILAAVAVTLLLIQ